jgi:hypothetical protein
MKNYSMKTSLLIYLFVLLFFSQCKQKSEERGITMADTGSSEEVVSDAVSQPSAVTGSVNHQNPVPVQTSNPDTNIQRMLTKEGSLRWETNDVNKTHAAIITQAKKLNAYISNDNQTRNDYQITTNVVMRIPSDKFDEFISTLENDVSKFDEKRIDVLDVTEEYIDISARMKTKKELEQHYYELLKQTRNVSEVLQVEAQLNVVRGEIESAEGRLKYLKDRVSMSTLNLTFYETTSAPVGFFGEIGKSFISGWKGFLYFILGIISIWPVTIVILVIVIWIIKRRRNR